MAPNRPRIAILGAGPAGCTLARLLHVSLPRDAVELAIFEREPHLHDRDQGGTLDLHEHTGLAALRAAGLADSDAFAAIARRDGDAMALCDKHMHRWISLASSADGGWFAQQKPEVDRLALRRLLLDSLPEKLVVWGRHVVRVEEATTATFTLHFADGTNSAGYDLIIGADGTNSVVRPLLTQQEPFYSGVGGWNMLCRNAEVMRPLLTKLVNRGSLFAFSDGKVVMGQQLGSGDLYISMWGVKPEDWMKPSVAGYDVRDSKAVKTALLREFRDWAPEVRELLACFDEATVWPRSLVMLPPGIKWAGRPGVTALGDAAHVMCPFVGEGVNSAMADAMELASAIISTVSEGWDRATLTRNIREYEEAMFARTHKVQKLTEDMMKLMLFTPGAPRTVIERYIVRSMSDELSVVMVWLWRLAITLYYFFFKLIW